MDNIEGYAAGGADVTIGSIDTGVDFSHPEFTGRLIAGKDWVNNDNDPSDTPDEGHGTHTTGTMAGSTVGVAGVSGAAPHVKVYVQRVCGAQRLPHVGDRQRDHGGRELPRCQRQPPRRHQPEPRRRERSPQPRRTRSRRRPSRACSSSRRRATAARQGGLPGVRRERDLGVVGHLA